MKGDLTLAFIIRAMSRAGAVTDPFYFVVVRPILWKSSKEKRRVRVPCKMAGERQLKEWDYLALKQKTKGKTVEQEYVCVCVHTYL